MALLIQIYSLLVSFMFGGIFAFEMIFFNKLYLKVIPLLKFLLSLVFVLFNGFLYFVILFFINNGVVHLYFFIAIVIGYYVFYKILYALFTHFRKK